MKRPSSGSGMFILVSQKTAELPSALAGANPLYNCNVIAHSKVGSRAHVLRAFLFVGLERVTNAWAGS